MIAKLKSLKALTIFRLFSSIIALDILAVIILAGVTPFELINPFRYLEILEEDNRLEQILYFPKVSKSFELNTNGAQDLIPVPVKLMFLETAEDQRDPVISQARAIISALARGGNSLKVERLFTDPALVTTYWFHEQEIILGVDRSRWAALAKKKRLISVQAIEKTMLENIPGLKAVQIRLLP